MTYKKTATILVVATILVICALALSGYFIVRAFVSPEIDEQKLYQVVAVKDGDTFDIMLGRRARTIRMLGIDTPETIDPRKPVQCYGKEASEESKRLLNGKNVRLQLNPHREEEDRYGRYLAYAYLGDIFINQYLLEKGYAREYTFGKPYAYQGEFRKIESQAKKERRGLWGACKDPDYKTNPNQ